MDNELCILSVIILLAFACLALACWLLVHSLSLLSGAALRRRECAVRRRALVLIGPMLLVLLTATTYAEEGMKPWFPCGVVFWGECDPAPSALDSAVHSTPQPGSAEQAVLSPDTLAKWGTPVLGPGGALSYQLPPKPLLELFRQPGDETARAYLTWLSEKTRAREEAFAAIKRVAPELGYAVGHEGQPLSGLPTPETLSSRVSPELLAGLMPPIPGTPTRAEPTAATAPPLPYRSVVPAVPPAQTQIPTRLPHVVPPGGHTRIFYFFSPRCPYCERQTPLLNELLRGRTDVVGIAMDTTEEELLAYIIRLRLTFPVVLDRDESTAFGVTGYPTVVALGPDGVARRLSGVASRDELQRLIEGGL